MKYYSLASGSTGNCFLIDNGKETILIDVGIQFNKIKEKLEFLNYKLEDINYILITHSHIDHIRALNSFSMNKVYSGVKIPGLINELKKNSEVELGTYKIFTFPLSHDVDCCGYRISFDDESLVYLTDTGYVNHKLYPVISNATYYIFESNHDVKMLLDSKRPFFLKSRILSDKGHLSNEDASEIICNAIGEETREICLAHISRECNTKELAYKTLIKTFNDNNLNYEKLKILALDKDEISKGGNLCEKDCLNI